jgi:hypothetical protein
MSFQWGSIWMHAHRGLKAETLQATDAITLEVGV